ncbi:peptidyl-tRNA hydrolase [Mycoplasmopsis mustelae]|uniref:Peptidyl-tRNA hydrolase n=1 Tax=Mycoplasmopsis mustelae TaxID=171289 RepID=A0A4R7UDA0_9BACT|nr:aminoacyl-tRNA hydrolase [Mycoplasmopsis mustelae]TDV24399.1 peptidyl-tRNA hydrolase [Mycoplasmopsis mustelae]
MKLIVGLGNPGIEYKYTRHNVGFLVIDEICRKLNITLNKNKFKGEFAKIDDIIIAKPLTFMNLSGQFISQLCAFFKIKPDDVMVIHDEKDYELGKATIKIGGSGGSHNGVKNIVELLNSESFKRLRIGIKVPFQGELKDFVLGKFSLIEIEILRPIINVSADAAISYGFNDINTVMNKFNKKNNGI